MICKDMQLSGWGLCFELLILAHYDSVDRDKVGIDFTKNAVLVLLQKSHFCLAHLNRI